jgi:hypothetical protein
MTRTISMSGDGADGLAVVAGGAVVCAVTGAWVETARTGVCSGTPLVTVPCDIATVAGAVTTGVPAMAKSEKPGLVAEK